MANNGKTSSKLSEQILDAFEILAQAEVNSAQFDKTITGIIISCEDEATGRYKVQYQDAIFYAFSTALDVTYHKGVSVQVKIPNNDFSGRKMIIGTVEENGIDYGTIVEDPLLRYEYVGVDCIGSIEQNDLSSYWNEDKNNIVVYDKENNLDLLNLNEEMINENLKNGNSLLLGATFRTNIPDVQRFKGDYGIKYTLTFRDIANVSATIDRYYIIDIDKMSGDPYNYKENVDQIIPFDIDSDNFIYVKKIELFARNFVYKDDTKPADIFISNLRFQIAYRIPDEEFAGTALSVLTPEGNYFSSGESNIVSKRAIAQLRIKGKITESTTNKIKYYWFIEDLRINKTSDIGYHKYGGRGWKCQNLYNVTEGTEENPITIDYISGDNTFIVKKDNSLAKETKYKCVIEYNGQILEKEFYFINYDITNEVVILSDRGTNFINSVGATTLSCTAMDAISYQWARVDIDGTFEALKDTDAENNEYHNAVEEYTTLQTAIQNKVEPNNEINQKLLAFYQSIIQKYNNIERREKNQIINLQAGSIFQEVIYKCQAFDINGNNLGIGTQLITNYISAGEDLQTGGLVINNGSQVFKYNAKGIAPTSEQFDEPQVILPLSFTLRNAQGIEIPMDALRDTDITWTVPIKNTMIKNCIGSIVSHDEELGVEVYNGKSLGYNINENYYANKDNNEIELKVQYQGIVYVSKTNLYFTKDGENGTNGTDYVLKILPSVDTIGKLKTVKAGETGGDWLRIQLWYNGIKIYEGYNTGNATTGKQVKLNWEMLGEKKNTPHNITVVNNGMSLPTWTASNTYNSTAVDIAKAVVEYDNMRLVATAPIIYTIDLNYDKYKVSLKNGTGFTHVVYSQDGLVPDYDSHTPFEISVQKLINDQWGDLTGHDSLTYEWSTVGDLKIKSGYTNTDAQIMFEPIGKYNSEEINHAIICIIKEDGNIIGTLHIPVHFLLNTYGNAALNEWDGNSISLDADGNTMLLAPQGGFGKKENNGSYTGVLLGTVKDYTNGGLEHTGLLGYNSGTRTLFLNSENGSAIFGKAGQNGSQIVIDPNSNIARLYTNNFYIDYDTKTGLPASYESGNESGKGALIDLTTPEIRWGNENFVVDTEGHITARGGGSIAGWNIDDNALFTGNKNANSNVQISSSDFTRTINGTSRSDWRIAFSNNFGVSSGGIMHAASGIIGSGTNKITLGKSSGDTSYSAIYSGSKSSFGANASGFYIGTDGIALGGQNSNGESKFQVTNGGILTAREGTIGGWNITRNKLSAGNITFNSNGSMSGGNSDGGTWSISTNGTATFNKIIANSSGTIGGWTLGSTYLRGTPATSGGTDYIQINSNGSITSPKWTLNRNGAASFSSVTITGGSLNINDKFKVGTDGAMTATAATITGKVTATEGKIAGFTISGDTLYGSQVGMDAESGGDYAFWAGAAKGSSSSAPFRVGHDGAVTCTNLTATGGTIGGCSISNGTLQIKNANIDSLSVGKITAGTNSADMTFNGAVTCTKLTATGTIKSGSTISGATISGGSINITKSGYYLRMGIDTDHPQVSGLNVAGSSGGINMNGSGISNCGGISRAGGTYSVTAGADLTVRGDSNLYLRGGNSAANILIYTSSGFSSLSNWIGGETKTFWLELGKGDSYPNGGWKQFVVQNGLIKHIY